MASVIVKRVTIMVTFTYGKCALWQTNYGKCNYGKTIMENVTEPILGYCKQRFQEK